MINDRKRIKYIFSILTVCGGFLVYFLIRTPAPASPLFFLGTDRSFSKNEKAYVNLEGSGNISYEFRVYKIKDPQSFLVKKVKERLVKEKNDGAFANPIALFSNAVRKFEVDFRKVARKEFNSKTRSSLKTVIGVDYDSLPEKKPAAIPALLSDQELVSVFSVPTVSSSWAYRRIPVPVNESGVYLIEGVSGSELAYTILIKSGLNFLVKQSDSETFIYAGRKDSGEPVSNANIVAFGMETGATIFSGKTEEDGTFFYKGKSQVKNVVLLSKDGEYAVSDPEFYASSYYGQGGVRAFLYTDRPVYRPGDTVKFKGIVRNFTSDQYKLISGSGTISVYNEDGATNIPDVGVSISGDNGSFAGEFQIPDLENLRLGNYSIILDFRDKSYQTEFAVEAYKKPTFLVSVSADKSNYLQKEEVQATVKARYYYGQPLAGKEVSYRVFRRPKFEFSPVGKLNFDSSADYMEQSGQSDRQEVILDGKAKLDSQGIYKLKFSPGKITSDSIYSVVASVQSEDITLNGTAVFSVNRSAFYLKMERDNSVYEPGSSAKLKLSLIPYDKSLSEEDRKKLLQDREIEVILYQREIEHSAEGRRSKVSKKEIATNEYGTGEISVEIPKRGQYIFVASAKDPDGNSTESESFFWASSASDSIEIPFKDITLKPGKDIYGPGETAEILVLSPISGSHLVLTVEGNRIFRKEVVKMNGNALKYKVKITPEMSPNFTLSAAQFSGNEVYKSQVRVAAPQEDKFLKVDVVPGSKVYRPGEVAEIKLKTTGLGNRGIPAEVSVALVDEAIYQIREEQTPNINTFFYHPRRNNVQTSFASAYRFFGYSEDKRLKLALNSKKGNGYAAIKGDEPVRGKFKDTGYWNAKVKTGVDGTAVVKFTLPDNLTSWRVTAIAITSDTKVGRGQVNFVTKKDLMLLGSMPRYILKGEDQKISATISNQTQKKFQVQVNAKVEGGSIQGASESTIVLEPGQNQSVSFVLKAGKDAKEDAAKIKIFASGGGYSDSFQSEIPLKTWGLQRTVSDGIAMSEGEAKGILKLQIPKELADPKLEVRLSPATLPALRQSLDYLADYPYGCAEQTMSRFYPLLSAQKAGYINERLRVELPKMIESGLKRITELQRSDGGFGWFDGETTSDLLMSAYVYRGLAISRKNGVRVDSYLIDSAKSFLYNNLDEGKLSPNQKAYILFSLSEGGKIEDSIVEGLAKSGDKLGTYGKALLSMILLNNGKKAEAIQWFKKSLNESGFGNKPFVKLASYGKNPNWEEDRIETISSLLSVATRLGEDQTLLANLASTLISNRVDFAWNNSRDTSAAVLALSEYLASVRESESPANVDLLFNGAPLKSLTLSPKADFGELFKISVPHELIHSGENRIEVKKKDGPVLYAIASIFFTDRSKKFSASSNGIKVKRTFYKLKVSGNEFSTSETKSFQKGDLIMVSINVQKEGEKSSYFQVEDILLPGFSFLQKDAEYLSDDRKVEYQGRQIYDDRAVFFIKGPGEEFTIRYFLRAEVGGKYKAIPARSKLMYYPEVSGASSDDEVSID
ncbi:alpha-2-macroglobulin [Leptospira perolatii]|uniref:Alpha-2-macroglobulin n=1 Tax=Leptospira perolatii TaxID=2023191 RepID=A0A2M9ZKS7_9LEPT|nr:alpha-2-macroglobulin family protein [Leptospira perolatii]PJZ69922.1 alpha-2-macroglobulin [Leptospira perolatii]PJZ72670.1 alpha-2-macroglobulin [Leptospira perolatii]